jgi:hypothetical protein
MKMMPLDMSCDSGWWQCGKRDQGALQGGRSSG